VSDGGATVEFCGELYRVVPDEAFTIGREGDLVVDDNPYLHRTFLTVQSDGSLFWLLNVGARLTASITSGDGTMEAALAPGAKFPLVEQHLSVRFSAGAVLYELAISIDDPPFRPVVADQVDGIGTTIGVLPLTTDQRILVVALAESALRMGGSGITRIPASAVAAERLGWTETKFNRKLDNVCDKLTRAGVRGLKGSSSELASSRRARLVEYALAVRLVTKEDLALLP